MASSPSDSCHSPQAHPPVGHTPTYCPYRSISDEQKVNPGWNLALEKPELQVRYVIGLLSLGGYW